MIFITSQNKPETINHVHCRWKLTELMYKKCNSALLFRQQETQTTSNHEKNIACYDCSYETKLCFRYKFHWMFAITLRKMIVQLFDYLLKYRICSKFNSQYCRGKTLPNDLCETNTTISRACTYSA